ncbi:hypothetical protein SISSUDRAFT_1066352 [Sistotremastrum suecicum HHB10207 ss-3]|uniref:DUF6535 domain-containing protein n=1 Tax=Sistotremastrum suecicum HHB10207 ss-3 TaxID=1314776 RepID=A0A165YEK3_9AGAM|nr:hypothetical protein SISSUDRAFT_1066352 [Sistotremastrum suecicum HHB10207 ss-3]
MPSRSRRFRSPRSRASRSLSRETGASRDTSSARTIAPSPSKFDQLLELLTTQNGLIVKQSNVLIQQKDELKSELHAQLQTMEKHTDMLTSIEEDATRDNRGLGTKVWNDDHTWSVVDKECFVKIKVMVDECRDLMQVSLVFIALFLTVVTAFISPIIQYFTSPPANGAPSTTRNPLPSVPLQLVALFYYMALITSIFSSVLCVLGGQWGQRLLATPRAKTNLARALAREQRMLNAEGTMRSLMGVIVWTLLLSIGFFVLGFLIQLWDLSFSFKGSAPILITGGVFATGLALIILGIVIFTTVHAAINDNSVFESPVSNAMKPLLQRKEGPSSGANGIAGSHDLVRLLQCKDSDGTDVRALKTYAQLVLSTSDMAVLEQLVPSFEFGEWYLAGDSLFPIFKAVYQRFVAPDTTVRVKETIVQHFQAFGDWSGWFTDHSTWREDLKANQMTRWCRAQCPRLTDVFGQHRWDVIRTMSLLVSLEEINKELRPRPDDTHLDCVGRALCVYDCRGVNMLGDRADILTFAIDICDQLQEYRKDAIHEVFAHVDRASAVRSLILAPCLLWGRVRELTLFIARGQEVEILTQMSHFFSTLSTMNFTKTILDWEHPLSICSFLEAIMPSLPSDFAVPPCVDLSGLLALLDAWSFFDRYCLTMIYYLNRGGFQHLSNFWPAKKFWDYCSSAQCGSPRAISVFHKSSEASLIPLPPLSSDECNDLADVICALTVRRKDTTLLMKDFKRPIMELLAVEARDAVVMRILGEVQRSDFISLLIERANLPWDYIQYLVIPTARDHALEILAAMSSHGLPNPRTIEALSAFLEFLGYLVPSLPFDFMVPPSFNLSAVLLKFALWRHDPHTWRKHGDIITFYLDHGAFAELDRQLVITNLPFFQLLSSEPEEMKIWDPAHRTSEHTRARAQFYLEQYEALSVQNTPLGIQLSSFFPEDTRLRYHVVENSPDPTLKEVPREVLRNFFRSMARQQNNAGVALGSRHKTPGDTCSLCEV